MINTENNDIFRKNLAECGVLVQEKIRELLNIHLDQGFNATSQHGMGSICAQDETLNQAIRYSLFSGGKYLRGFIVIEMGKLFNVSNEKLLILASIVEMIHCYSLIHDDLPLLDNSDLRRGIPSCHKKFGEANALLAGSLLLTLATEIANHYFSSNMVSIVNKYVMLMIRGQAIDWAFKEQKLSFDEIINMYKLKTGAMFALASLMGCTSIDQGKLQTDGLYNNKKDELEEFGYNFGILFQIYDDIQDVGSEEKSILKVASKSKIETLTATLTNKCMKNLENLQIPTDSTIFKILNTLF